MMRCSCAQFAVVYDIDANAKFFPKGHRRMAGSAVAEQPSQIGIVKLVDVLSMSFALGHDDVLANMRSGFTCSKCLCLEPDLRKLRRCDGVFPSNAGLGYPAGGDGLQFACNRGLLCDECAKDLSLRAKYWPG